MYGVANYMDSDKYKSVQANLCQKQNKTETTLCRILTKVSWSCQS